MYIYNWQKFNENREHFNKVGAFKKVYTSKSNSNIVIKTFDKDHISSTEYEEMFYQDHPDLYAKIYKIDYKKRIMIQERLDTNKIIEDISVLHKHLPTNYSQIGITFRYIKDLITNKNYYKIKQIKATLESDVLKIFNKLLVFLSKVLKIDPTIYNLDEFDLHYNNIGYDKKGKIKLLDL